MTDRSPAVAAATDASGGRLARSRLRERRPVLSFLALVGLVAALLGGVRGTGAVNPRLAFVPSVGWGEGQATAFVELTNDGPLSIEIEAVDGPTRGIDRVEVLLGPSGSNLESSWPAPPSVFRDPAKEPAGQPDDGLSWTPVEPFVLEAGESRMVLVQGLLPCLGPVQDGFDAGFEDLQVDVRTWLGAHQRVEGDSGELSLVDDVCT